MPHLRAIERHRELDPGALNRYEGATLDRLWREELLYGEARIESGSGLVAAVAAPWVTSLAGFLLAAETLKHGVPGGLDRYQLGPNPSSPAIKWEENLYISPEHGLLSRPSRWASNECLCRSPRRRRLLMARYGLDDSAYPA